MAGQLVAIQAFDSNGVPAAGAKFFTYAAGTTTPKAAYADEAGTVTMSNPVVANAYGIMYCWLKSGIGDYKLKMTDSTGAILLMREIDNFTPLVSDIYQIYGENLQAIQDAVDVALAAAEAAQAAAELAATNAQTAETNAESAETNAESAQAAAELAATNAQTAETNAETAETNAEAAQAAAEAARDAAQTAETNAETAETNAETAETNAEAAQALAEAAVTDAQAVLSDVSEYVTTAEDTPVPSADVWTFNPATAVDTGADDITRASHPYADGQLVLYTHGGGTAIGGLTTATLYYITNPGANDFQLAATRGGAAIDLTSTGAGTTHTLADVFSLLHYAAKAQTSADDAQGHEVGAAEIVASMEEFVLGAYANATAAWANPSATANQSIYYNTTSSDWRVLGAAAPQEAILAQYNTAFDAILTDLSSGILPAGAVLDEDNFATDSATKPPSQQSTGAYIKTRGTIPQSIPASGVAGTADAITLTVTGGPTLADGLAFLFQPEAANTGGVTINYNSGGAVELLDAEGAALAADDLATTAPVLVRYDNAAAKWRLLSGGGGSATAGLGIFYIEDYAGANDGAQIKAALTAAEAAVAGGAAGALVIGQAGKTYSWPSSEAGYVIGENNVTIDMQGATIAVTGSSDVDLFKWLGTAGAQLAIAADVADFDESIDLSDASTVSTGNLVLIANASNLVPGSVSWNLITEVVGKTTNTLDLAAPIPFPITVAADTEYLSVLTPVVGGGMRNCNFDFTSASGTTVRGVQANYTRGMVFENLSFSNGGKVGLKLNYGYMNTCRNIRLFKCGQSTEGDYTFQAQSFGHSSNIVSHYSAYFAIKHVFGCYNTGDGIRSVYARGRGLKFQSERASNYSNIASINAQKTGISVDAGTGHCNFVNLTGIGNGETSSEPGLWLNGEYSTNLNFTNVTVLNNYGDWDFTSGTNDSKIYFNGIRVTSLTRINVLNSTTFMTNIFVEDDNTMFAYLQAQSAGDGNPVGPVVHFMSDSGSPADLDILARYISWGRNDASPTPERIEYAEFQFRSLDITDGEEDGEFRIRTNVAGTVTTQMDVGNGVKLGSPTGGYKGTGTLNAVSVYDDNTLLTDLVIDLAVSGAFDAVKYASHPVKDELSQNWFDPDWYADYWRKERRLPGMLTWEDQANRPAVGELVTRLTAVAEAQAVLIQNLNQRLKALESMAAE